MRSRTAVRVRNCNCLRRQTGEVLQARGSRSRTGHRPATARSGVARGAALVPKCERGEVEAGRPALGAPVQAGGVLVAQLHAGVPEKRARLARVSRPARSSRARAARRPAAAARGEARLDCVLRAPPGTLRGGGCAIAVTASSDSLERSSWTSSRTSTNGFLRDGQRGSETRDDRRPDRGGRSRQRAETDSSTGSMRSSACDDVREEHASGRCRARRRGPRRTDAGRVRPTAPAASSSRSRRGRRRSRPAGAATRAAGRRARCGRRSRSVARESRASPRPVRRPAPGHVAARRVTRASGCLHRATPASRPSRTGQEQAAATRSLRLERHVCLPVIDDRCAL